MEEEKKEEVVETTEKKEKKQKNEKGIISRLFDIVLWLILFGWMSVCVIDYINVVNEKEPKFCINNSVNEYDDGNVYVCTGAGYVVYHYDRNSYKGYEFGPFWTEDRSKNK